MILAVMLTGGGKPTVACDTMFGPFMQPNIVAYPTEHVRNKNCCIIHQGNCSASLEE